MAKGMVRRTLRDAGESVRELGWSNGCLYLFSRVLEKGTCGRVKLYKYYFVAQPVNLDTRTTQAGGRGLSVIKADFSHPIVRRFPRPPEVIEQRFRDGAICFVVLRGEEFGGFLWLQEGQYREDEVRCIYRPLPSDLAVWDYDVYVEPRFRLTRCFTRLWEAAHAYLRAKGYRWTMSRISGFNRQSLLSHERLGATFLGSGIFLTIAGLQLALLTTRPFFHLSLSPSSAPELRFRGSPDTPVPSSTL